MLIKALYLTVVRIFLFRKGSLTKVVHHKYTYKDGKRYGPYLYESKRVDGRVVTSYLGSPTQKFKRKIVYAFLFALLLGVVAFFIVSYFNGSSTTGRVAFDVNVVYKEGEPLDGDLKFRIKEGELVPSNAQLLISYGDQSKTMPLSELVQDATISGTYYAEGTLLGGEGEGYGAPGVKLEYPTLTFDLLVYSGDELDVADDSGDSGAGDGSGEEIIDDVDESAGEGTEGSNEGSGSEMGGAEGGAGESQGGGNNGAGNGDNNAGGGNGQGNGGDSGDSGSGDSGNDGGDDAGSDNAADGSSEGGGPSISGAFVSESEFTVPGEVSHEQEFGYTLSEGQRARIVPDSVRVNGEVVPDSAISISADGNEVTVSTDYFISEEGFGEEFLGDYAVTLEVDIEQLGLTAVPGDLGLTLLANDVVVASYKQDVQVAQLPVENATVPTITQIADLPLLRIGLGGSGQIDLGDYFTGAESFDAAIDNMTVSFDGDIITITPQDGFTGSRKAHVVARAGGEQLDSNDFTILVSSGAVRITTERDKIVVGQPVRWEKTVVLETAEPLNVELPEDAERITVKKLEGGEYVDLSPEAEPEIAENAPITGGILTGDVVIEVDLKKESFLKRMYKKIVYAITGNVVDGEEPAIDVGQDIVLDDGATQYTVEYYTPAPQAREKDTLSGKQVTISAPDDLHYSDVIASSELPNSQGLRSEDSLAIYWHAPFDDIASVELKEVEAVPDISVVGEESHNETLDENLTAVEESLSLVSGNAVSESASQIEYVRVAVPFDAYDIDEDGFIDYVEWVVPHLSNQTYDIVYITEAQHLDVNRTIINDITNEVKFLDGVWSEPIGDGEYVRVTYEINLTSNRDITVYPRTVSGTPRIDVYEVDGNISIASFESLSDHVYNKVYLTGLEGEQDTFDLRILGGVVEFDHIIDPADSLPPNISFIGATPANASSQSSRTITVNISSTDAGDHYIITDFDRDLVLWMRMDEINSTGAAIDSSTWSNNGSNMSGATRSAVGYFNSSFSFDGVNDYIRIADPASGSLDFGSNSFTLAAWIKTNGTGAGGTAAQRIINKRESGTNRGYEIYIESGSTLLNMLLGDTTGIAFGSGNQVAGTYSLRDNKWHHIAVVFNRTDNATFFIDGTSRGAQAIAHRNASVDSTQYFGIGLFTAGNSNFFNGSIDEVLVFNRSLSPAEIGALYNASSKQYFRIFTNLSQSSHAFRGYAVDLGNNVNLTGTRTVTVDYTSPIAYLQAPANGSEVTTASWGFNATFSDNNALSNATFYLWNSTGGIVNTTANSLSGTAGSVNLSVILPYAGTFLWNYLVMDNATNSAWNATNYTITYTVAGDTISPVVSINSPTNRTYTLNELPFLFNVTLNEEGGTVMYTLNGGVNNVTMQKNGNTDFNATNASLASGQYTFRVYANDSSGNRNNTANIVFSFNNTLVSGCTNLTLASAVYTLNQSFSTSGSCLQVQADGISVVGNDFTLTDSSSNTDNIGINATGRNNITVRRTTITGFNRSVFIGPINGTFDAGNALLYDSAVTSVYAPGYDALSGDGSDGGIIRLYNTTFSSLLSVKGGNATGATSTGNPGTVEIITSFVNLSARTVVMSKGLGNSISLNYEGIVIVNYTVGVEALGTRYGTADINHFRLVNASGGEIKWGPSYSPDLEEGPPLQNKIIIGNLSSTIVTLRSNFASLNTSASTLNTVANVTFYGMPGTFTNPAIFKGGSICTTCTNFTSLNAATVIFNVTDWSGNYTIAEDQGVPLVSIAYPLNTTYAVTVSALNYSVYDNNLRACWYTLDNGVTNVTLTCGTNATGLSANQGSNTWRVYANDTTGNSNSTSVTFAVDSVLPVVTINSPLINLSVSQVTFNVTVNEDAGSALFSLDGGVNNVTMQKNGNRDFNFTNASISDGTYTVRFFVNDTVGNLNNTSTRTFYVDTVRPNVQFVSPTSVNGSYILTTIAFNITASDTNFKNITVRVFNASHYDITSGLDLGGDLSTFSTTSPLYVTLSGYEDGVYYANASAYDAVHNFNYTETRTYFVDNTAPAVTLVAPTNNTAATTSTHTFNATFSDAMGLANATFYLWNATALVNRTTTSLSGTAGSVNLTVALPHEGVFRWNYYAGDSGSNYAFASLNYTITYDAGAPLLSYTSPTETNGSYLSRTYVLINATASDSNLQSIVHRLYNASSFQMNISSSSSSPLFANFSGLADGRYYFNSTANDTLGNTNRTTTRTIVVDTIPPFVNLSSGLANGTYTSNNLLGFSVDASDINFANLTLFIYNSTGIYTSEVWSSNPPLSLFYEDPFPDGVYYYNATASDLASNTNRTVTRTFTVDTIAPGLVIVSPLNTSYSNLTVLVNLSASGATNVWFFNGTGNESYTSPVFRTYSQGSNTLIAYANDSAGNLNQTSVTFVADTIAPTIDYIAPTETHNSYINRRGVLVNVSASDTNLANITIEVYNASGLINRSFGTSSVYGVNVTTPRDGQYFFNATASDSLSNRNYTTTRAVNIDTVAPVLTILSPLDNQGSGVVYGSSVVFEIEADEELSACNYTIGAGNLTMSGGSTTFNATNASIADGLYTANFYCWDLANNFATTNSLFVVDTTAPVVTINSPSGNLTVSQVLFNVSTDETVSTGRFTLDGGITNVTMQKLGNRNLNYTNSSIGDGTYTVRFFVNDTGGNMNSSATRTFIVDTTKPTITVYSPLNTTYGTTNITVNFTSSDALAGVSARWFFNGTGNTTYTGVVHQLVASGSNTFIFYSNDSAGNTNSTRVTFAVDNSAPAVDFTTATVNNGGYTQSNFTVNVTASDTNLVNITVRLYNGSGLIRTNTSTTSPFALVYAGLPDGAYAFNATATDILGNTNRTETRNVFVDTVAPVITTIVSPLEQKSYQGTTMSFIVQVDEAASCSYTLNAGVTNYSMAGGPDEFSATNNSIADGGYQVLFYCQDEASNTVQSDANFVVDNVASTLTIISPTTNFTVSQVLFNITTGETDSGVGARVTLTNGLTNYTMTRTLAGKFNYTNTSIGDGTYTARFFVNDSAGNMNSSVTRTFIVDTIKPVITVTSPANTTYPTTNVTINFTSSDVNGISARWFFNETGNTTYTGVTSVVAAQGSHTFVFYSNDTIGNTNSTSVTFTVNSATPTIDYVNPTESNNTYLARTFILVNVTASDNDLQTITNRLYDASSSLLNSTTSSSSPHFTNFSGLSDGRYHFDSVANDSVNNVNTTVTRTVVLDTTRPLINFFGSTRANGSVSSNAFPVFEVNVSDTNFANVTLYIYNTSGLYSTAFDTSVPLVLSFESAFADGVYTFNATTVDLAGNTNRTETRTFTIDSSAPTINFTTPTPSNNSYSNSTSVIINVTGVESSRSSVSVTLDSVNYTMTCIGSTNFTCNYSFVLSSGVHTVRAHVNDTVGSTTSTEQRTFTIDSLRPGIIYGLGTENTGETVTNLSIYMNVSLNESNVANVTFSLYNTTTLFNRTTVTTGAYAMNWTNLPAGIYRYEANVTDLANNRNGTVLRTVTAVSSCLGFCTEGSACALAHRQCYLTSDMCSGGVCDFVNFTMQNSTVYALYNATSDANVLIINVTSNSSTSIRFLPNSTFVFSGKNGSNLTVGSRGGHAGIVNITTAGLFNRTNSRFMGVGGLSTVSGAGGNGGLLQVTYHGLIGTSSAWTTSFRAGNSTNATVGSAGAATLVSDGRCPRDPDGTNNGLVDGTDVDTIVEVYYGNITLDNTFNSAFDFNCDGIINVQDIARIGFQFGRR